MDKTVLGWLSLAVAVVGYAPYFYSVLRGRTKPHLFSWLVWAMLSAVTYAVQGMAGAGPGAWAMGLTAVGDAGVACLAIRYGEKHITRGDWISLAAALGIVPLWLCTQSPLTAIFLVLLIDAFSSFPTFRKSYRKPREEMILLFAFSIGKHALALAAMERRPVAAVLVPVYTIAANAALCFMLFWRRRAPQSNAA